MVKETRLVFALLAMTTVLAAQTEPIYLTAGDLRLTFSGRTGMLVSALDQRTNTDLIHDGDDNHGGGWRILLQSPDGRRASAELANAASFQSRRFFANGRERLSLVWHALTLSDGSTLPDAQVSTEITASPENSSTVWQFDTNGFSTWSVIVADSVDIRRVSNLPYLFFPESSGRLYRDPVHSLSSASWLYPTNASMQFMAVYSEKAGFFIAAQDTLGDIKGGAWKGQSPGSPESRLTFTHIVPPRRKGAGTVPYAVELRVFHGDWQTAAELYRGFVETSPWVRRAAPRPAVLDNTFETLSVPANTGLRQREALSEMEGRVSSQVKASGAPVIVSLGDWAQLRSLSASPDAGPQMGWASLEGTLQQLRRIRVAAAADVSAWCVETSSPCGVTQSGTQFGRGSLGDLFSLTSMLARHGINILTLDLWPDGHPATDSADIRRNDMYRVSAWRDALAGLANRSDPGTPAIGAKQPVEFLLPQLRFFRTRTCNTSELKTIEEVPAFDFVYHAYTSLECDADRSMLTFAKALTTGQRVFSSDAGTPDSEDFLRFLKNSTLARRGFAQPFLAEGTMLPNAVIEQPASSSVSTGVWRARSGEVGIALANTSHEPTTVRIQIDFPRWGLDAGRDYTLSALTAGGPSLLASGIRDTTTVTASVDAFDVVMVSIREESVSSGAIERIVNAARADEPCGIAPGEVVDIFGNFGGSDQTAAADLSHPGPYPLTVDETSVSFDGVRAAVLMASASLVRAIVPWTVSGRASIQVRMMRHGISSASFIARVQQACPGVYSIVRNADGSPNSDANPASRGSVISIYGTGLGTANSRPQPGAGFDGSGAVPRRVMVTIGGIITTAQYAGFSEKIFSGVYEIRVPVPQALPPGQTGIVVSVGEQQSLDLNVSVN